MYHHVLPYTMIDFTMYCHIPACTAINRFRQREVRTSTYFWIFFLYQYVLVSTDMYHAARISKSTYQYILYHGTKYVLVCTAIYQVYRIPDDRARQHHAASHKNLHIHTVHWYIPCMNKYVPIHTLTY